jgi:hypothetical protein
MSVSRASASERLRRREQTLASEHRQSVRDFPVKTAGMDESLFHKATDANREPRNGQEESRRS